MQDNREIPREDGIAEEFNIPDEPIMLDELTGELIRPKRTDDGESSADNAPEPTEAKKTRKRRSTAAKSTDETSDTPPKKRGRKPKAAKSEDTPLSDTMSSDGSENDTPHDFPTSEGIGTGDATAPLQRNEPLFDEVSEPTPSVVDEVIIEADEAHDEPTEPKDSSLPLDTEPLEVPLMIDIDDNALLLPEDASTSELEAVADAKDSITDENYDAPKVDGGEIKARLKEEKYDPEKPRRIDVIFDFVELFIFTLVAVIFVSSFFIRHSVVEGESMLGTLEDGDTLIISNVFYEPQAGDIVVVADYATILKKPIIKRVIAVGGDSVRVTANAIYVNSTRLDEPYVYTDFPDYTYNLKNNAEFNELRKLPDFVLIEDSYYQFTVPDGEIFVLGDHRNNSTDSRIIGTVSCDSVIGRVLFRLYPFDKFGLIPEA